MLDLFLSAFAPQCRDSGEVFPAWPSSRFLLHELKKDLASAVQPFEAVKLDVMKPAVPAHIQGPRVVVVMGVQLVSRSAHTARPPFERPCLQSLGDGLVRPFCEWMPREPTVDAAIHPPVLAAVLISASVACFAAVVVSIAGVSGVVECP